MTKLKLTFEIEVNDMSEEALSANGFYEYEEEGGPPKATDYSAGEIGRAFMLALESDDAQAEAFAGSDIFVAPGRVTMTSAEWA